MEFSHPYFQRDHPYLLEHIKRKISTAKTANVDDKSNIKHEVVSKILNDVKAMKGRQETLDNRFVSMKQENEALWREVAILRQKHIKQQQIVNKLIQFLVTIVQPQRGGGIGSMGNMGGVKRRFQLMINDVPEAAKVRRTSRTSSASSANDGPIIRELTEELLDNYNEQDEEANSPYVVSPGFQPHTINEYDESENITDADQFESDAGSSGGAGGSDECVANNMASDRDVNNYDLTDAGPSSVDQENFFPDDSNYIIEGEEVPVEYVIDNPKLLQLRKNHQQQQQPQPGKIAENF